MIVQSFVCLHTYDIVPVEQPVQLLTGQGDDLIKGLAGPFKACLLETLLPQTKAVAFPVKRFDFVSLAVTEQKKMLGKRIQFQCTFNQYAEARDSFSEIYSIPAHVNQRQIIRWSSHSSDADTFSIVVNVRESTSPAKATDTPLGKPIRHWLLTAASTCTCWNRIGCVPGKTPF